jgi:hypothetical protein
MSQKSMSLRDLGNGQHWVFLCFTPERAETLNRLLSELIVARKQKGLEIGKAQIPAGVLWNGRPCTIVTLPKAQVTAAELGPKLHGHLGYELPEPTSDVFTLGVTPEEDAALDRVGLLGTRKGNSN